MLFEPEANQLVLGIVVALVVVAALLVPFLVVEIRKGKRSLGPLRKFARTGVALGPETPMGAGDNRAGRPGNPAPGDAEPLADPYSPRAQRSGPPIQS